MWISNPRRVGRSHWVDRFESQSYQQHRLTPTVSAMSQQRDNSPIAYQGLVPVRLGRRGRQEQPALRARLGQPAQLARVALAPWDRQVPRVRLALRGQVELDR